MLSQRPEETVNVIAMVEKESKIIYFIVQVQMNSRMIAY